MIPNIFIKNYNLNIKKILHGNGITHIHANISIYGHTGVVPPLGTIMAVYLTCIG